METEQVASESSHVLTPSLQKTPACKLLLSCIEARLKRRASQNSHLINLFWGRFAPDHLQENPVAGVGTMPGFVERIWLWFVLRSCMLMGCTQSGS